MRAFVNMIKNTHRHTANQALHCIGAPFYAIGAVITIGNFTGMRTDLVVGAAMWLAAVGMFVAGHTIEKNLRSMTPIVLFTLMSRKAARYLVTQRVHFLRI